MPLDIPADVREKIPAKVMADLDSMFSGEHAPSFDEIMLLGLTTAIGACLNPTCALSLEQKSDIILAGILAFRSSVVLNTLKLAATGQSGREFGLLLAKTPEAYRELAAEIAIGIAAARDVLPEQVKRLSILTEMLTDKPASN